MLHSRHVKNFHWSPMKYSKPIDLFRFCLLSCWIFLHISSFILSHNKIHDCTRIDWITFVCIFTLGNHTYHQSPFPPRILFAYNLDSENSQIQTNTILIVCIIVTITLSLLAVIIGIVFLFKHSKKVDIVVSENSSVDSQVTVRNYIINPMTPCPHSATMARRNVHFPDN